MTVSLYVLLPGINGESPSRQSRRTAEPRSTSHNVRHIRCMAGQAPVCNTTITTRHNVLTTGTSALTNDEASVIAGCCLHLPFCLMAKWLLPCVQRQNIRPRLHLAAYGDTASLDSWLQRALRSYLDRTHYRYPGVWRRPNTMSARFDAKQYRLGASLLDEGHRRGWPAAAVGRARWSTHVRGRLRAPSRTHADGLQFAPRLILQHLHHLVATLIVMHVERLRWQSSAR